jgi:hypothetical protein
VTIWGPFRGDFVRNPLAYPGLLRQPSQFTLAEPRSVRNLLETRENDNYLIFSHGFAGLHVDFERSYLIKLCLQRPDGRGCNCPMGEACPHLTDILNQSLNDLAVTTRDQSVTCDLPTRLYAAVVRRGVDRRDVPEDESSDFKDGS